jgi:ankyrin repeat protein
MHGSYEAAEALCAHGAELDTRDYDERTPLMKAAYKGHTKICELLLALGADPSLKDECGFGQTALDKARRFGESACVALLQPVTPGS